MFHRINLRQVEAFKAVIETGTVSRAAELLRVTQPAVSKLITHLEMDTGLKLFDRHKGRLSPSPQGMRLYAEIDHIFSGIRQIEIAVEAIRREDQGRLSIGVLPSLSGTFIQRSTNRFLHTNPNVFCSIHARSSQWIVDWVGAGKLDIGLVSEEATGPHTRFERLLEQPLACIMSRDHPLTAKNVIEPKDLHEINFISYPLDSNIGHRVHATLKNYNIAPRITLLANWASTIAEFVASGLGVSLVHPLIAFNMQDKIAVRRFEPEIFDGFQLCYSVESRNSNIVDIFSENLHFEANNLIENMLKNI